MAALFWRGLYESCLLSAPESCFAQRNAEYKSQRNFDAVRNDKGNHAPAKDSPKANRTGVTRVYNHKPGRAKSITDNQPKDHGYGKYPESFPKQFFHAPHKQGGKNETDNIAARSAKQNAGPCLKAGEYRNSHKSH